MTSVVIPNVVRTAHVAAWTNGRPVVNVEYWTVESTLPGNRPLLVQIFANKVTTEWETFMTPQLPNNYLYSGVQFLDLNSVTGISGFAGNTFTGGATGEQTPPALSTIITKAAPGTRQQRNGRIFLPTLTESIVDENGNLTGAGLTGPLGAYLGYVNAVEAMTDPLQSTPPKAVLASWDRSATGPVVAGTSREIASYSTRIRVGRQGRRLTG